MPAPDVSGTAQPLTNRQPRSCSSTPRWCERRQGHFCWPPDPHVFYRISSPFSQTLCSHSELTGIFCRRTFSVVNLKFNKNWLPLTTPSVSLWPYEIFTETISLAPSPRRSLTPSFIKNSPVKHLSAVISEWNTGIPISEKTWGFHRTHNSFTAEFSVGKELPCSLDLIHIDNRMLDNSAEYWQNQRNTDEF